MTPALAALLESAEQIILGKTHQLRLAVCCLLARGHLLIEDVPGVGKTTLAHTLAHLLGLDYQRIQFTSDLLPSDILGASVYDADRRCFEFRPGPVFHQMILADEINRATPKAQSALLEAMEEHQVTVEGETVRLPTPFFVIATQNPTHQTGTFPLPESQLDRFLMRIELGYPDRDAERALLTGRERARLIDALPVCLAPEQLAAVQSQAARVHASDALLDYLQALLDHSRSASVYHTGLSPRAGLALLNAAKAWAYMNRRDAVIPEDVQTVLAPVAGHRLRHDAAGTTRAEAVVAPLLEEVAIG